MNDIAASLPDNLITAVYLVSAVLTFLGLLAMAVDGFVDDAFFRRLRYALVRSVPFRDWMWLLVLLVLTSVFKVFISAPGFFQSGRWDFHALVLVVPDNFRRLWFINIFEEIFRFGTFFLLIRFARPTVAVFVTTLLFTLAHDYYSLPIQQALAVFSFVFVVGCLLLFIGLRFGFLTVYAFHIATNSLLLGAYIVAPPGWLWVNWVLVPFIALPLVYTCKRAKLWGLSQHDRIHRTT